MSSDLPPHETSRMQPATSRTWQQRGILPEPAAVDALSRELGISSTLAKILLMRDLHGAAARQFLSGRLGDLPDPLLLPDMAVAAARLAEAVSNGETVVVHGDYDVDGMSGTALLVEGLRSCGARVDYHIPLRLKDGYGLSATALREAAAAGASVVVSVDCGVSAVAEAALAKELGLDLVITDHHQPPPELPSALAIVNPQRSDSRFPDPHLAGVGVAFFLLAALRRQLREAGWFDARREPDLRQALDLVALGTIADLVPLQGINRILTRTGLALLEQAARPGIRALKQVAVIREVNCGTVGFQLAPRLNAAGRLEDASRGVALLLETDPQQALQTAQLLDRFNRERRELEQQTFEQALRLLEDLPAQRTHSIVLAQENWHPGVIGIVASRLVERFHRPTVLIALEQGAGKGSARSIRGCHLFRALQNCAEHLASFGGHAMAAGLSLCAAQVDAFAAAFEAQARQSLDAEDLVPQLRYDGEISLAEIDLVLAREFEGLSPCGMGNPEPQMVIAAVQPRRVQIVGERHVRFVGIQEGYSHPAIAFGMADRLNELQGPVDLMATPQVNQYNGRQTVQLRVKDWRPARM